MSHLPNSLQEAILNIVPQNILFGAAFSQIAHDFSGAPEQILIKPHFGVSNIKWRIHIPLEVHEDLKNRLFIEIFTANGVERRDWSNPIIIDDSFEHQVVLSKSAENSIFPRYRTVLLIDIWNQTLPESERKSINEVTDLLL